MKQLIKDKLREELLSESRLPFNMDLPADILQIKDVFKNNKYDLFVVGGAVRDAVLGVKPKDFDLATDAVPDVVERIMQAAGFRTLGTGKSFGVINVFTDAGEYEIATFRSDSLTGDGRRPDSVSFTNIETDVKRRDLTMNALFYDIDKHQIVDLVNGVSDLKKGIVRTVGHPVDRFNEDKLRILRAIRLAARFGSDLDADIDAALKRDASLNEVSGERIRDEFIKGIKSAKSVKHFLELLDRYQLFNFIFKGLHVNKEFLDDKNIILQLAVLLKGNSSAALNKGLNNLKYPVNEIKAVIFLLNLLHLTVDNVVALKRQEKNAPISRHQIIAFANREKLDNRLINAFLNFELTVSGEEVMQQYNLKPSKELGDTIDRLEKENFLRLLNA